MVVNSLCLVAVFSARPQHILTSTHLRRRWWHVVWVVIFDY